MSLKLLNKVSWPSAVMHACSVYEKGQVCKAGLGSTVQQLVV